MSPDFEELVGTEGSPEELSELRRMHELLLSADPPPSFEPPRRVLPPHLRLPVRARTGLAVGLAAAFSAALGVGTAFLATGSGVGFQTRAVRTMHGVGATAAAHAVIKVGRPDGEGNRPLEFSVQSLPALTRGDGYELYLTEHGKLAVPCGVFQTGRTGMARVRMNAPADLEEYDGWVVTAAGSHHVLLST